MRWQKLLFLFLMDGFPFVFSNCAGWAVTETGPPTWSSLTEQSCSSLDLLPNSLSGTNLALHSRCKTVQLRCLNICNIGDFTPSLLLFLKYIKWSKNTSSNVLFCTFGSWSIFCKLFSQIQVDVLSQLLTVVHSSSKQSRVSVRYILNYEAIFLNYENCLWLENWCISSDDCCRWFSYRAKLLEHAGMDSVDLLENALVETNKWTWSFLVFKS